ncbi:MAG: hypothetical protein ACYC56_11655 [Candidatus Aquicultor sp.]
MAEITKELVDNARSNLTRFWNDFYIRIDNSIRDYFKKTMNDEQISDAEIQKMILQAQLHYVQEFTKDGGIIIKFYSKDNFLFSVSLFVR